MTDIYDKRKEKMENARIGYQVASNLWICENQVYWSRFSALVLVNSILLAAIAVMSASDKCSSQILHCYIMPCAGIILCILWLLISLRSSKKYFYYMNSARELEEKFLSDIVKTSSREPNMSKKEGVCFPPHFKESKIKMRFYNKLSIGRCSYCIIGLFAVIYIFFLIFLRR